MDDGLHQRNAGVTGERGKAWPDDGLAEDLPVLLGQPPAGAQPAARCDNDGCDASDHALPVEGGSRHGLARRGCAANLHIAPPMHSRSDWGSFALQHLRIRPDWLNSMQPGDIAQIVCNEAKYL